MLGPFQGHRERPGPTFERLRPLPARRGCPPNISRARRNTTRPTLRIIALGASPERPSRAPRRARERPRTGI
eukprot:1934568-Pyramimonas_sp.AAC.1